MKAKKILRMILGISTCGMSILAEKAIKSARRGNKVAQVGLAVTAGLFFVGVGGAMATAGEDPVTVVEDQDVKQDVSRETLSDDQIRKIIAETFCSDLVEYVEVTDEWGTHATIHLNYDGDIERYTPVIFNDLVDVLSQMKEYDVLPATLSVWCTWDCVDAYGNEDNVRVWSVEFDEPTLAEINWENMYGEKFMKLNHEVWILPQFRGLDSLGKYFY